ncbi:MAG: zf-HC2 domain-containing protein [Acidobacteriota bacterium]
MNCKETQELIQLFLDSELDSRNTLDVQAHLETCYACTRQLDAYAEQDRLLKDRIKTEKVDSRRLLDNIRGVMEEKPVTVKPRWFAFDGWKRVAAIIVLGFLITFFALQSFLPGGNSKVYADVVTDHANHCSMEAMMGIGSDSAEFNLLVRQYGGLVRVPDLSTFGYASPQARPCLIDGLDFLHIAFYSPNAKPISLFVRPHQPGLITDRLTLFQKGNYRVAALAPAGVDLIVVTSGDESQAKDLAELISNQLQG